MLQFPAAALQEHGWVSLFLKVPKTHHLVLGHDLMCLAETLLFFHFAIANFLSDRLPFTHICIFFHLGKVNLSSSFFSGLEMRCEMPLKRHSSNAIFPTKNMHPLISIPLNCLSEGKGNHRPRSGLFIHLTDTLIARAF